MFCPKCGAQVSDHAAFCPECGTNTRGFSQSASAGSGAPATQHPMSWFKFLIYFGLFAGAVLNAINGVQMLTGAQYDGYEGLIYRIFDGLQTVDILVGIALLALAAFGIYTRMRLAGYYRNGPKLLISIYVTSIVISLLYILGVNMVLGDMAQDLDLSSMTSNLVMSVIMIFANKTYFQKRADLFVN